jgi:argininosuccinate synthase
LTKEQVARALNAVCQQWLRRKRGTGVIAYTSDVIQYHQDRNAAAMRSRGKLGARLAL